jgi:hypothetical protein
MASWSDVEAEAPELAALARAQFDGGVHKTIATLRRDGSPRISGTECTFAEGELWWGSMAGALKARDLQRDPRFALHSASESPPDWSGDAKVSGTAEEIADPAVWERVYGGEKGDAHLFRADVTELVVVRLDDAREHLLIESWHPGRGVTRLDR